MDNTEEIPISIGEAAEILGVSVKTLRRWFDAGKIPVTINPSGHRRYYLSQILQHSKKAPSDQRITVNYAH